MSKCLLNKKIAILVANGFNEQEMTEMQKLLQREGAHTRIISMTHGLVNSWTGTSWGHHFAADGILSNALAVDYSMLVVPGGRRSVEKLKLTAHTKRFINGFLQTNKPLAVIGDAVELLISTESIEGREIAGPDYLKGDVENAGAQWSGQACAVSKNLLTCDSAQDQMEALTQNVLEHFKSFQTIEQAA